MAKEHPFAEHGLYVPPTHVEGGKLPIPGGGASRKAAQSPANRGTASRVINHMQRNLMHLATPTTEGGLATDEDIEVGRNWYPTAQGHARRIGSVMGTPQRTGAALISSLSPQTEWGLNLIKAHDIATHGTPTHADAGWSAKRDAHRWVDQRQNKAEDVIRLGREGQDPTHLFTKGLKTHSFLENIDSPTNPEHVTIDTHAHNAAVGSRTSSDATGLGAIGRYNMFASAYHGASQHLGLHPSELQARVWTTWKRMNPMPQGRNFDDYLKQTGKFDDYYSR
jgi:hypothetical protein